MSGPGTAVVRQNRDVILATLGNYTEQLAALAPKGTNPEHYVASLRLYLAQNEKLLECTPASVAVGMLRVAQTGLDLGVSCDLLPFKNTCQFSPRYNGIIELALGSGVRAVNADVVREGDAFDWRKGTDFFLHHKRAFGAGAKITHAYAIAEIRSASFVFEVLSREEIEEIRARFSKQWKTGPLEAIPWYGKKTAVRRLSPYLPKNARFAAALMYADQADAPPEEEPIAVDVQTGEILFDAEAEGAAAHEVTEL